MLAYILPSLNPSGYVWARPTAPHPATTSLDYYYWWWWIFVYRSYFQSSPILFRKSICKQHACRLTMRLCAEKYPNKLKWKNRFVCDWVLSSFRFFFFFSIFHDFIHTFINIPIIYPYMYSTINSGDRMLAMGNTHDIIRLQFFFFVEVEKICAFFIQRNDYTVHVLWFCIYLFFFCSV